MRRVRAWLTWSPFDRGTWQYATLYYVMLALVFTIASLVVGVDLAYWLGSMAGVALIAIVCVPACFRNSRRAQSP